MKKLMILMLGLFMLSFASAISTDNLIAYWKMEDATSEVNSTSYDLIGAGGTPTFETGLILQASNHSAGSYWNTTQREDEMQFNESGDDLTISFWLNLTDVTTLQQPISNRFNTGWKIVMLGNSSLRLDDFNSGSGAFSSILQAQVGEWIHYAITKNSSHLCIFINGTQDNCQARTGDAVNQDSQVPMTIGVDSGDGLSTPLLGRIDEIGIWTVSLSATEISELYNSGSGFTYPFTGITYDSINYTEQVEEGSITSHSAIINVSGGTTLTSGNLYWNGTKNIGTIISLGGDQYNLTTNITVPEVASNINVSFFWEGFLDDGTTLNSTTNNQTVTNFGIDDCSVNTNVLYNFSIVDETSQALLNPTTQNTTAEVDLQVYSSDRSVNVINFSQLYNQTNTFSICMSNDLSNGSSFVHDAQIQYQADDYVSEFYHIQNADLDASTFGTNITLYNLDDTTSQEFKITFKDDSFLGVEGALIQIQRKYISEGLFKVVEIPITDSDGVTLGHFALSDEVYNLIVIKDGEILGSFTNILAVCDNIATGDCKINLNTFSSTIDPVNFIEGDDFSYTLTFNRTSNIVSMNFAIPSGVPSFVVFNLTLIDGLGTTSICTDATNSAGGNLGCLVPIAFRNATVKATITKDGVLVGFGSAKLQQQGSDLFGSNVVFLTLFLYLTLIGIGLSDNPMITGVFLLIGAILSVAINLTSSSGFIGTGATILWLGIAIILTLIKGSNRQ